MTPIFAERCGFENPMLHKPNGKRVLGIMVLSNLSVFEQTKMRLSRHSNLKVHARYQHLSEDHIDKKYEAMNPLDCASSPFSPSQCNH